MVLTGNGRFKQEVEQFRWEAVPPVSFEVRSWHVSGVLMPELWFNCQCFVSVLI